MVLGQHLGQIMSNVVKKVKKQQAISLGLFYILLADSLLKEEALFAKPEWKFMAIIARNAKF